MFFVPRLGLHNPPVVGELSIPTSFEAALSRKQGNSGTETRR